MYDIGGDGRQLSRAPHLKYLGCCYFYGSHAALPAVAHADGRKPSPPSNLIPFVGLPAQGQGASTLALGRSSSLGRCCLKAEIGKSIFKWYTMGRSHLMVVS